MVTRTIGSSTRFDFGAMMRLCAFKMQTGRGPLLKMQWVGIALPKHIEAAIRFAKLHGWRPDGASICEIGADSNFDPVTFRVKPNGASRYWFYDDCYGVYSPRNPHNPNMLRRAAEAENAE